MVDEHGEQPHGEQEAETPEQSKGVPPEMQRYVDDALKRFATEDLNRAITAHGKRLEGSLRDTITQTLQESRKAEREQAEQAGQSAADVERRKMETRMQTLEKQLTAERDMRQSTARSAKLQSLLSGKVADLDVAAAYFQTRLKVDSSGDFYGEDDTGGIIPLEDFIERGLANKPSLQAPSKRSGSGGTGPSQQAGAPRPKAASMSRDEWSKKLAEYSATGDESAMSELNTKILNREIIVPGVNDDEAA